MSAERKAGVAWDWWPVRVEACRCGGFLRAVPNQEISVRYAVQRHQRTLRHQAWWAKVSA